MYVVDNSAVVVAKINEFKSSLQCCGLCVMNLVGLDFKTIPTGKLLILSAQNNCLIINLSRLDCVPKTLKQFLADESFCFVGTGMSDIVEVLQYDDMQCGTGIDIGYFAARFLKKPKIERYGLADLGGEVGLMDIKKPIVIGEIFQDWSGKEFSKEEIKYVVHKAYTSYVIMERLFQPKDLFSWVWNPFSSLRA